MDTLIESSVWVDYLHPKTPRSVRETARTEIARPSARLCEPVILEVLRGTPQKQRTIVEAHFSTIPVLPTPVSLWSDALHLGQVCHDMGWIIGSLDLLIASLCLHHQAELVTFDARFAQIAKAVPIRLRLLKRAT